MKSVMSVKSAILGVLVLATSSVPAEKVYDTYTISETETAIINYRYVQALSQSETAKRLGVSQMFVSRMEHKLLLRLKEKLKDSI